MRLLIPQEVTTEDYIKISVLKEKTNYFFQRFRHQTLSPIFFAQNIAYLTAFLIFKFREVSFIVFFDPNRTYYFALIFECKCFLMANEHIKNNLRFFLAFMRLPTRHLSDSIY